MYTEDPTKILHRPLPQTSPIVEGNLNDLLAVKFSDVSDELNIINGNIQSLEINNTNRLIRIENLIKDNDQKDKEILDLKRKNLELEKEKTNLHEELTQKKSSKYPNLNLPAIISLNFPDKNGLMRRIEGFEKRLYDNGAAAINKKRVLIEFSKRFPTAFSLHLEACSGSFKMLNKYKIYIGGFKGTIEEKERYKEEFGLPTGYKRSELYVVFKTNAEECNNIITIDMPELEGGGNASLHLYDLTIIPRDDEAAPSEENSPS